jgi:sirohydrochlorin ferrochelatase
VSSGLLLVAHGTRDAAGARASERLAEAVRHRLAGVDVRLAYVDVRPPSIAEVLPAMLADLPPDGWALVVPAFLASGYHVRRDLPAQLAACGATDRVRVTGALGPDPRLATACADRLCAAGWRHGDAVVLATAGSADLRARAEGHQVARALARRLGCPVRVSYLAGEGPRLDDTVAQLHAVRRRVAVASWLLAPGEFQNRLLRCAAEVRAAPLSGHPLLLDAVLARYQRASGSESAVA